MIQLFKHENQNVGIILLQLIQIPTFLPYEKLNINDAIFYNNKCAFLARSGKSTWRGYSRSRIDTPSTDGSKKSLAEQQLVKIKITDLPTTITNKLKTDSYHDWIIQDAYKNMVLKQYSVIG